MDIAKRSLMYELSRAYQNAASGRAQIESIKTFGDALALFTKCYLADSNLRPRSKAYCNDRILALKKFWPDLMNTEFVSGQRVDAEVSAVEMDTLVEFVFGQVVHQLDEDGVTFVHRVSDPQLGDSKPCGRASQKRNQKKSRQP